MKVTLQFDSLEEFDEFRGDNDGGTATGEKPTRTRRSRKGADVGAQVPDPAPIPTGGLPGPETAAAIATQMPNAITAGPGGSVAPSTFAVGGFPGTAPAGNVAPGPSEAVMNLVQRIGARMDAAIAGGHNANDALNWMRQQCGAEAAQATFDQIKQVYLPKLPESQLGEIAKLMAA